MSTEARIPLKGEIVGNLAPRKTASNEITKRIRKQVHPVDKYLKSLGSEQSRKTQRSALAAALAALDGKQLRKLNNHPDMLPKDDNGYPIYTKRDRGFWHLLVMEFPWWEVNRDTLNEMIDKLGEVGYAPLSVIRTMSAVKRTMEEASLIEDPAHPWYMDPGKYMLAIRRLKPIKAEPVNQGDYVPVKDWELLKKACDDYGTPAGAIRDKAMLSCAFVLGMRISEPAKLLMQDYDDKNGYLKIKLAKGGKTRRITLGEADESDARRFFDQWVNLRGRRPGPFFMRITKGGEILHKISVWAAECKECKFDFKTTEREAYRRNGRKKTITKCPECGTERENQPEQLNLSPQAVRQVLLKRCKQAGLPHTVWHAGRRSFAADGINKAMQPTATQNMLGHKDFSTTASYDAADPTVHLAGAAEIIRIRSGIESPNGKEPTETE